MAWDRALCANKRGVTVWLPTLFIFHGTMQMALKGSMRRKQKGNEQRWVAPRKSLPHIITLDYTLQWRLDAVRRLQSRRRAFRGSIWFEFFFFFCLIWPYTSQTSPRSDRGHACYDPLKCGAPSETTASDSEAAAEGDRKSVV